MVAEMEKILLSLKLKSIIDIHVLITEAVNKPKVSEMDVFL